MRIHKVKSLRGRLIFSLLIAALLPILLIDLIMYNRYLDILHNNTRELTQANLQQTKTALGTWIDSYGDIMYQVYSDDGINKMLNEYYNFQSAERTESYLNSELRSLLHTKDYIMAITIVTSQGDTFFCDKITPSSSHTFWINHYSMTMPQIYELAVSNPDTTYFSTEYAKTIPSKKYYLFHMAHSTTYNVGPEGKKAVVIVSIDEQLLEGICNPEDSDTSEMMTFIVDSNGYIVSFADSSYLSKQLNVAGLNDEHKKAKYLEFVKKSKVLEDENLTVEISHENKLNWDIINVSSKNHYEDEIAQIQQMVITLAVGSGILVIGIILVTIRYLLRSIDVIVDNMNHVKQGDTKVRISNTHKMPDEVATIAEHLNKMLDQLDYSIEKEKLLSERERVAEIAALEARINPHFLYNTLDTINWMAIDNNEVEISNAISALGKILRYGINESNGVVTIATELDWLNQYIFLQQTRLKDTFEYVTNIDPEVMQYRIHKLLLQPFVENSIIHGFNGKSGVHRLEIKMTVDTMLNIEITDNGIGMGEEQVQMINSGKFQQYDDKYHVGMENAFQRINMYYGENTQVYIKSSLGVGTTVCIQIPKDGENI